MFFFVKIVLAILSPLEFHVSFIISLSISMKNSARVLIVTGLNLYINLGSVAISAIWTVPIHKHGIPFYWFRSLISFNNTLHFPDYKFHVLSLNLFLIISFWCYFKLNCFINFNFRLLITNVYIYSWFGILTLNAAICWTHLLVLLGF